MPRFKFAARAVCALLFLAFLTVPAMAAPIPVKVLVLTMFEIGENSGDAAGEFQHWYVEYFDNENTESYEIRGAYSPLFVNGDGVAGTVTGMGKARAAATLMAILKDPRFDFSKTYFITSGCSGVSPERGTLGDVFICDWAVDYELGHSWKESDAEDANTLFLLNDSFGGSIKLNASLVELALSIAKDIELDDDPKAAEYRKFYAQEAANSKPSVRAGASVTSDSYWHGKASSRQAFAICEEHGASVYGVSQMEDNAFAEVLRSMGHLDRYLVVRDVSNFDQPHSGQTVTESLKASSGGFSIGMINGHRVGSAIVRHILKN